ncbi:hypothetical protein SprV_0100449000 [Sparganum proliferum]
MCALIKSQRSSEPLNEGAIQRVHEKALKKKKKKQSADRYVARASSTRIIFESIDNAKKLEPIALADVTDIGRSRTDANVFSFQVQQNTKKKEKKQKKGEDKQEGGPVLLYLIRFEDDAGVETFFSAINGKNDISHSFEAPPGNDTEKRENGKQKKAGGKGSVGTARNDGLSAGTWKRTDNESTTAGSKKNGWKAVNGNAANVSGTDQPPVDGQWTFFAFPGSQTDTHHSQTNGTSSSRRDDNAKKLPQVLQRRNNAASTQTFVQYQPPVGHYRVAPTRKSRMTVGPWEQRSFPRRRASMPPDDPTPLTESSMTSASSEVTLRCSVTPTYRDTDSEVAYQEARRRRRGMYKSYRCRDQDSIFYGERMSPESQMLDQMSQQDTGFRMCYLPATYKNPAR